MTTLIKKSNKKFILHCTVSKIIFVIEALTSVELHDILYNNRQTNRLSLLSKTINLSQVFKSSRINMNSFTTLRYFIITQCLRISEEEQRLYL